MLQLFPFLGWLAVGTSVVLLVMLFAAGDLRPRGGALALVCLIAAAYCQFFGGSAVIAASGLVLQTLLAVTLIVRWRLAA